MSRQRRLTGNEWKSIADKARVRRNDVDGFRFECFDCDASDTFVGRYAEQQARLGAIEHAGEERHEIVIVRLVGHYIPEEEQPNG